MEDSFNFVQVLNFCREKANMAESFYYGIKVYGMKVKKRYLSVYI